MTELTPDVLKRIADILSPQQAQTKRATHVSDSSTDAVTQARIYYYVELGGFGTVVSSVDCPSGDFVFEHVTNDRLQPWYRLRPNEYSSADGMPLVMVWSHNDFCDWLRRRE